MILGCGCGLFLYRILSEMKMTGYIALFGSVFITGGIFLLMMKLFNQKLHARACLKKAYRELRVPICRRFYPNEGGVAGYGKNFGFTESKILETTL